MHALKAKKKIRGTAKAMAALMRHILSNVKLIMMNGVSGSCKSYRLRNCDDLFEMCAATHSVLCNTQLRYISFR